MRYFDNILLLLVLCSCSHQVKEINNSNFEKFVSTHQLVQVEEKRFLLDSNTAKNSKYIQIINEGGGRTLTFLNKYKNSIYFYDYDNAEYLEKIEYPREGANSILEIDGFHIKNRDSIYLYNRPLVELIQIDSKKNINQRIPLKANTDDWFEHYPQYNFNTVCPIREYSGHLILPGFSPFGLEASKIEGFRLTGYVNIQNNALTFMHKYPLDIYGDNACWQDPMYTQVYPQLLPTGKILYSFPASHDLYLSDLRSDSSEIVYGGSNFSKKISSMDWDVTSGTFPPDELMISHYLQQDLYCAVLYDSWRNCYYRFVRRGISGATSSTPLNNKSLGVILLDKNFKYLGETELGTENEWNWSNSFVTKEGLNIEYISDKDIDEDFLEFKIFQITEK